MTAARSTPEELLARWRREGPRPQPTREEVVQRLTRDFQAYEIPLYTNTAEDYANDEEVREDLIDTLLTITDRRVLARLSSPEDLEVKALSAAEEDEYWRELFVAYPDEEDTPVGYRLLIAQHAFGARTSIVLECEDGLVTGFKLYGHIQYLVDLLFALIGCPERVPGEEQPYPTMIRGDITDDRFLHYLRCLDRFDWFEDE